MIYLYGTVNSIIHEFQVEHKVHVGDRLRNVIDQKLVSAVQRENMILQEWKDYWMQRCLMQEFPSQNVDKRILKMPDRDVIDLMKEKVR